MYKKYPPFMCMVLALSWLFASCQDEDTVDPAPSTTAPQPRTPVAPTARAGNDTTLFIPFISLKITGEASTDPDKNITFYAWKQLTGPTKIEVYNSQSMPTFYTDLPKVGSYEFELTVTDADKLSSKDTVKITVAMPPCKGPNKEVVLKNLVWTQPFLTVIEIPNPHAFLPPNSYIKDIYIKRDFSNNWELVSPISYNPFDYGSIHLWEYGNKTLLIHTGPYESTDTPDVKIEYCQ
ncbi:PKD domain-containing protein [Nibribacter koreensis]